MLNILQGVILHKETWLAWLFPGEEKQGFASNFWLHVRWEPSKRPTHFSVCQEAAEAF